MCAECPARLAVDVEAAFPAFLEHHQDLVFGIALRLTGRPSDAEELAQDAFVRAYRALRGYPSDRLADLRSRGWLAAIVRNLGRDRARRRRPAVLGLDAAADLPEGQADGPDGILARRESARAWRARLDALPSRYGEAVALRHVDGLSYPELAEATGRPLGTVKSDVHRGVRMLRAMWRSEHEAEARREPRGIRGAHG